MPPEPLILGFDTSAAHCAAALLCGGQVLAARHEVMVRGQAERLMPMLAEVLAEGGAGWRDLVRIGVGVGPGNFTGVRIAVAAARGLALARGIPAVGVDAFAALAESQPGPVLAAVDARGGRMWLCLAGGAPMHAGPEEIVLPPCAAGADCTGHRAEELARLTGGRALPPALPLAEAIARIAARARLPQPRPAPLYLRPADAAPPTEAPPPLLA